MENRNSWLPATLLESTFRASGNFGVGAKVMSDLVYVLGFSVAMETERVAVAMVTGLFLEKILLLGEAEPASPLLLACTCRAICMSRAVTLHDERMTELQLAEVYTGMMSMLCSM